MPDLPDYLIEAKARQLLNEDPRDSKKQWEDLEEIVRRGYLEIARTLLIAQLAQSDIKR